MGYSAERPQSRGAKEVRHELQSEHLFGSYRAVVEYNNDPMQQGRVKIRLFQTHGPQGTNEKERVKTDDLPWAFVLQPLGGGQDYGAFMIPPVGSSVVVQFLGGDPELPVIIGGYYSINKEEQEYLRTMGVPKHDISMAGGGDVWKGNKGPEVPIEALEMAHNSPEVYIPVKTPKGAALVMNDRDEREHTALIDRAGQGLFLEGEVTKGANTNNAKQRKANSVVRASSPISIGDTTANETRVLLIDGSGQSVVLHAHQGSERIKIVSRPVEGDNVNHAGGKNEMAIELDAGSQRIVLRTGPDAGMRIMLDAAAGHVEIAGVTCKVICETMEVTGRMSVKGDLVVNGDTVLEGDAIIAGQIVGGDNA